MVRTSVSEDRLAMYRRQAALKLWAPGCDLRQPPVNQIVCSLAEAFGVSQDQVVQDWDTLTSLHPFAEVVSLRERTLLRHGLLDDEMCQMLMNLAVGRGNRELRAGMEHKSESSKLATTVIWDEYKPRSAWRVAFNILPSSFFSEMGKLFRSMLEASVAAEAVDLGEVFVPLRMQFNVYPAGRLSGLAEHWDRKAIAGVASILLSPLPEDGVDDLMLNEELVGWPEGRGWVTAKLQRGSGLCLLAGTTHAVRTWVRTEHRVTLNVIF